MPAGGATSSTDIAVPRKTTPTEKPTGVQTDGRTDRQTTDGKTDMQANRQARQRDIPTDRQIYRETDE